MDFPLPQILEVMMEVVQIILQEFVQNRTVEQIVVAVGHGVEVYILPKELDEKVVELHFLALGPELTVLTQEQASCIESGKIACRRQWR